MTSPRLDFLIATTAALPWLTGTSVNPLFRARELARRGARVQLQLPWIEPAGQALVFPPGVRLASPREQEAWIRDHHALGDLKLGFYPARYRESLYGIFPTRALDKDLPACQTLILEEPDHLPLLQPWARFRRRRFGRVIGILHTNYLYYLKPYLSPVQLKIARRYFAWIAKKSCDALVALSAAVEIHPTAAVENVNGVADEYFFNSTQPTSGCYFIGKVIWEKGFAELIGAFADAGGGEALSVFGSGVKGSDQAIAEAARARSARLDFRAPLARPWQDLAPYRALVNCSESEVLCTTTAEALAMGKWAVIPRHPSNVFFEQFASCLTYRTPEELRAAIRRVRAEPPPACDRSALGWSAATDRLLRIEASLAR